MINKRILGRWTLVVAVSLAGGCGVPPSLPSAVIDAEDDTTSVFPGDADPAQAALPFAEDELLVGAFPGVSAQKLSDVYSAAGATLVGTLDELQFDVLEVEGGQLEEVAALLADSGVIESIHKSYLFEPEETPNDPMFSMQAHLPLVGVPDAWDVTVGSEDVIIAIVDTGVDDDHPDLIDRIIDGWNTHDGNGNYDDVDGHGTTVAGVLAASSDNRAGVAGVTWDCPLLAIRATDTRGRASARKLASAILWAVANDAKVINVSFAPLWSNVVVRAAAEQAYHRGALVVISAGNGGSTATATGYEEALFVSATTSSNKLASFSDHGPFVDLSAPGVGINSTAKGGSYRSANGTSFASPIVAGVAALAWSINPDLRPATIVETLKEAATDLGAKGKDSSFGEGLVDAAGTVELAIAHTFTPDNRAPSLRITRPANRATLSGRYTVKGTATDRWGVADVVLSIDSIPVATDTRSPYRFQIDTTSYPAGTHTLSLVATDYAGNATAEKRVTVTFRASTRAADEDAGGVTFTSPSPGSSVTSNVTIKATVTDPNRLSTIEWFVDGQSVFVTTISGRSSEVAYLWRTSGVSKGTHTITIAIMDTKGEQTSGQLTLVKR